MHIHTYIHTHIHIHKYTSNLVSRGYLFNFYNKLYLNDAFYNNVYQFILTCWSHIAGALLQY